VVTTLTFVVSFVTALVVRVPGTKAAPDPARSAAAASAPSEPDRGVLAGLRTLWRDRTMRGAMLMFSLINVGGNALFLAVVVPLQGGGASPRTIGIAVAGDAVGTLLGAAFVGRLHRRLPPGWLLIGVGLAFTVLYRCWPYRWDRGGCLVCWPPRCSACRRCGC
jgi:hypothetical protein